MLTAALLSSTYGSEIADTDFTAVVNPESIQSSPLAIDTSDRTCTTQITSKTLVDSTHTTTTHITLRGNVDFNPKLPDGTLLNLNAIHKTI